MAINEASLSKSGEHSTFRIQEKKDKFIERQTVYEQINPAFLTK